MISICGKNCDHCKMKISCRGCSLCEKPFCKKDCNHCFALCPEKGASYAYLRQLGGGGIDLARNDKYGLPIMITVLPDHFTNRFQIRDVIGIHGGNFFTSNGENVARVYRQKGLQETLNLKNPVDGVLQFYVKDRTLEGFWDNRAEIYKQLKEFPLRAVVSPNFSVYEDTPRLDHLYNIKRSSIVYNELLEAGLPAVPDISWYNKMDLDQWIKEINEKGLQCIAFSFQVVGTDSRASNAYIHYLTGFQYLINRIPETVHIIVAGMVAPKRINLIKMLCKNTFSVLNQSAYVHSRRGILSETGRSAGSTLSMNEILLRNVDFYEKSYSQVR